MSGAKRRKNFFVVVVPLPFLALQLQLIVLVMWWSEQFGQFLVCCSTTHSTPRAKLFLKVGQVPPVPYEVGSVVPAFVLVTFSLFFAIGIRTKTMMMTTTTTTIMMLYEARYSDSKVYTHSKQCAAVSTHRGWINEPPQRCSNVVPFLANCSVTSHGHSPVREVSPPTMRLTAPGGGDSAPNSVLWCAW